MEVRTPRRGRSSKTSEEADKERPKEAEKSEETTSSRGRRSGAAAREITAGEIVALNQSTTYGLLFRPEKRHA